MHKHSKSLFIFRRDLRLHDNTALIRALENSTQVMPCFIFDPRQIDDQPYRGNPSVAFLIASLQDLQIQLNKVGARLFIFYGQADVVVDRLLSQEKINAVFVNDDYTPFSQMRDRMIADVCKRNGVSFQASHDALLNPPDDVAKDDGSFYTVYTPYARKAMMLKVESPWNNTFRNYFTINSVLYFKMRDP